MMISTPLCTTVACALALQAPLPAGAAPAPHMISLSAVASSPASASTPISETILLHGSLPPEAAIIAGAPLQQVYAALRGADETRALAAATSTLMEAEELVSIERDREWRGTAEGDLAQLEQAAAGARAAHAAALADFRTAAFAQIASASGAQNAELARRVLANWGRDVPIPARALALSAADWHALKEALAKRATGAQMTGDEQRVMTLYDSSADAALVASRLAAGKAEYEAYMAGVATQIAAELAEAP